MMKHASNEKKHVPYLNGNPTRTVAISKALHCQILVWTLGLTMTTVKYDITLMVPLLHFTSNITLTAATELVFGHGRVGGPGHLHF